MDAGGERRNERRWEGREQAKQPPDPRTGGQRDRDRVLYSDYLRRLADVTQVAASHEASQFHNRLTHSLEVAQLARRMTERIVKTDPDSAEVLDPDVVETAALAHDLGHPPFGHCAETELNRLLIRDGNADGFEGNAQSFRIVTKLATRAEEHPGLDLSRASLQALTKYPWPREGGGKRAKKFGRYHPERADFDWSRSGLVETASQTPEAQIMDWADDVAYALHDIEDFYRAGLIPLDRLTHRESPEWGSFLDFAVSAIDPAPDEADAYRQVAADLREELPTQPWQFSRSRGLFQRLVPTKINAFTHALSYEGGKIGIDPDAARQVALLKQLTWRYVIQAPALAAQQQGQRRIVRRLYRYYRDAIERDDIAMLPSSAKAYLEDESLRSQHDSKDLPTRVACDIVASLSESQAIALFKRVTGMDTGSIFEPINA